MDPSRLWWRAALEQDLLLLSQRIAPYVQDFRPENAVRLVCMMLNECVPLVFSSVQHRFYMALKRAGAFVSVADSVAMHSSASAPTESLTCSTLNVSLMGASFDGETAVAAVSVVGFISGVCRMLAGTELERQLTGLVELPKSVCKALMFFTMNDGAGAGEFVLRNWLAHRFMTTQNEEMLSWLGSRASLLQTPDVLDMVYIVQEMPGVRDVPALHGLIALRHERLLSSSVVAFDTSLALMQRMRAHVEARDILTYYAYFMHCMHMFIMLESDSAAPIALANLTSCLADVSALFEASVAMLLGMTDRLTCSLLSRISPMRLEHIRMITETFRDFLLEPQLSFTGPTSIISTIFNRTINFTSDYSSTVQIQREMLMTGTTALFKEPAYAPMCKEDIQTFYDTLHSSLQVITLRKLHAAVPDLCTDDNISSGKYCVARLPVNVNLHCVDWSMRFYVQALEDLPALFGASVAMPHVGMDKSSIFLVSRTYTLALMQIVMAAHCMRFNQFVKTAPMYPLLAHLYTTNYRGVCSDGERALAGTLALNTVLNVVAYWLGIGRRTILYSEGVPTPTQSEAFELATGSLHVIADLIAPDGELDTDEKRNAVASFVAMASPHWINLSTLVSLYAELKSVPALAKTSSLRLINAILQYHSTCAVYKAPTRKTTTASGNGRRRANISDMGMQGDEVPLTVNTTNVMTIITADKSEERIAAPLGHLFVRCSTDADYTARANAVIYGCVLALPRDRCRHYLMQLHSSCIFVKPKRYSSATSLYVSAHDVVQTWASAGRPAPCDASFGIRPALHGANIDPFVRMLEKLEITVSSRDSPMSDPGAASCLSNFYAARETGTSSSSVPVSVYMHADQPLGYDTRQGLDRLQVQQSRRLAMFGSSICLVDLTMDNTAVGAKEAAISHVRRSTYGAGAVKTPSLCLNAVGSIYSLYNEINCASPELRSKTYEHVKRFEADTSYASAAKGGLPP